LASMLALARMADQRGQSAISAQARAKASETTAALIDWWKRTAEQGTLRTFKDTGELDPFIGKGDGLSLAVAPHRHKLALFQDLTPEVAVLIKSKAPEAVEAVWAAFDSLYRTWWLMGEERQVHFGENFLDSPDLALSGFRALAWTQATTSDLLAKRVDVPFCHADLYYIMKLAVALDANEKER
jgi:hypothetical protein